MAAHHRRSGGSVQGSLCSSECEAALRGGAHPAFAAIRAGALARESRPGPASHGVAARRNAQTDRKPAKATQGHLRIGGPSERVVPRRRRRPQGPPPFRSTKCRFLEPAREEAEQREHQHDNQNDPENAQRVPSFPYACPFNGVDGKPVTRAPPGGSSRRSRVISEDRTNRKEGG